VVCRLEKINNELAYCAPHMAPLVTVREVEVRLTMLDGDERQTNYDNISVVMAGMAGMQAGSTGIPSIALFDEFFKRYPEWHPARLKEVVS